MSRSEYMQQSVADVKNSTSRESTGGRRQADNSAAGLADVKRDLSMFKRDTEIEIDEIRRAAKSGNKGADGSPGKDGKDGVGITGVVQTAQSDADGGENEVKITLSDGSSYTFKVKNGSKGEKGDTGATGATGDTGATGAAGVGISSVVQSVTSTEDNGENVITITLSDESVHTFKVKNGSKGSQGERGAAFTYSDFTEEQLAALKGAQGDSGVTPTIGDNGNWFLGTVDTGKPSRGAKGDTGAAGSDGDTPYIGANEHWWIGDTDTSIQAVATSVASVVQTTESTENGGENIVTVFLSDNNSYTFKVKNGTKGENGAKGADGVGVASVEQTETSTASGGYNKITVTLTDGTVTVFQVRNGLKGSDGKTPARGTDYWTDADIATIKGYVNDAILNGEW